MAFSSFVSILLLIAYVGISIAAQNNTVCNNWNKIVKECETQISGPNGPSSQIGPKGRPGSPGPKGDVGSPGIPDNSRIEDLEKKFASLKRVITNNYVPRSQLDLCDAFHDGKCYVLVTNTAKLDMPQARAACQNIGAVPANIYSSEHFDKMMSLIRSRTPIGSSYHHVWTGMTVDFHARRIRLRNSSPAPFTRWMPERPFVHARAHVGIHVLTNSAYQGMFDEYSSTRILGVLCEI